jgi:hypothetical protein
MGRQLFHLMCAVAVFGICRSSWGQMHDFVIPSVSPPPIIDGDIDDIWATVSKQHMKNDIGEWPHSDARDISGYFQALYDSDYLYVLIDVNDSELRQDNPPAEGWRDDSAEFFFDGNNSKGAQGAIDADDFQYRFNWSVNQPDSSNYEYFHRPQSLAGVQCVMASTTTGYRFEVKFPWSTLLSGGAVPVGRLIGVDCFVNDDDNGGDREHQVAWHATAGTGWNTPRMWGTALLVESLKATGPNPPEGAIGITSPVLRWTPGETAVRHNVYLGTSPHLTAADRKVVGQVATTYSYAAGWQPGVTYYWRVDEVAADGTVYPGDLWHFVARSKTAYGPAPADGTIVADLNPILTWEPGWGAIRHQVFFGTKLDAVAAGTGNVKKATVTTPLYLPGKLDEQITYYWRVDEFDGTRTYKGLVWSFTVLTMEGFETKDFSRFPWKRRGDGAWHVTSEESHGGLYSAASGSIGDDETSVLSVVLACVAGDITFCCKVSSEPICDLLIFSIDGVEKGRWSGNQDWAVVSFPVAAGTHTFEWAYVKDSSASRGSDAAWIDDIVFPAPSLPMPDAGPTVIGVVRANGEWGNQAPIGQYDGSTSALPAQSGGLKDGNLCFSDRTYSWVYTPAQLVGAEYVRTFNSDKKSTTVTYAVTIRREATVMITVDDRIFDKQGAANLATARFAPAGTFVDVGLNLYIRENTVTDRPQSVFSARLPAGTYVFGAMPTGNNFYIIALMD